MSRMTYCTARCTNKKCKRHLSKLRDLGEKKSVCLADFAPACRYYIAEVLQEIERSKNERNGRN